MKNNQRTIIMIAVVVIFLCACCALVLGITGGGFYLLGYTEDVPAPLGPVTDPETGEILPEVITEMESIQRQIEFQRGLQPNGEFIRDIYTPEELQDRVINDFFVDYTPEEVEQDVLVLSTIGLLPPDYDLLTLFTDLFSEQVAGFYDDETGEMVVVQEDTFGLPQQMTYAHEYVHALQDQNYDFDGALGYTDELCETDSEKCSAIQALIEGDASFTEYEWLFANTTFRQQQEVWSYYDGLESPVYDRTPKFLQEDFLFPYTAGYEFVSYLYTQNGYAGIDAAYKDLPVSTEQILHPEKYPSDIPIAVTLPDLLPTLGEGWELIEEGVMGEWYTYLVLAYGENVDARVPEENAKAAAAGWGGDAYQIYHQPSTGQTVFVIKYIWDATEEREEFEEHFRTYSLNRFGPSQLSSNNILVVSEDVTLFYNGQQSESIWIQAPTEELALTLMEQIP